MMALYYNNTAVQSFSTNRQSGDGVVDPIASCHARLARNNKVAWLHDDSCLAGRSDMDRRGHVMETEA